MFQSLLFFSNMEWEQISKSPFFFPWTWIVIFQLALQSHGPFYILLPILHMS